MEGDSIRQKDTKRVILKKEYIFLKKLLTIEKIDAIISEHWSRRFSSVGRASALQAEGQRFEPVSLHHLNKVQKEMPA